VEPEAFVDRMMERLMAPRVALEAGGPSIGTDAASAVPPGSVRDREGRRHA
jgi:hypothetical protein